MIDRLFQAFRDLVDQSDPGAENNDDAINLAAAALMIEVARSDTAHQSIELQAIEKILIEDFHIDQANVGNLIAAASENVEAAHDLYQFTQHINDAFNYQQKRLLIFAMWLVAYADGHVDDIEDHIIRRVAGLIHLDHADFIQQKRRARDQN